MEQSKHVPVMMAEVLEGLKIKADGRYWDGTFGRGGHASQILKELDGKGRLWASDRDEAAAALAHDWAGDDRFAFHRLTIEEMVDKVPAALDGFLWDLGVSTPQLKEAERGFSFAADGPLDMRMDQQQSLTAETLVNETEEEALANLIYTYGEERLSRRIAHGIVMRRAEAPIRRTLELAEICVQAYPRKYHRIHPATRTFQALRIVVNDELGGLARSLPRALDKLALGGRAVVISFHSLEDRIVKAVLRDYSEAGKGCVLTRKPLVAGPQECEANPASRSAKLRIFERQDVADGGRRRKNKYARFSKVNMGEGE